METQSKVGIRLCYTNAHSLYKEKLYAFCIGETHVGVHCACYE